MTQRPWPSADLAKKAQAVNPGDTQKARPPGQVSVRHTLLLISLPVGLVLVALLLAHALRQQPVLVASLASSAVSVYLDPRHEMNSVRTLATGQFIAAGVGFLVDVLLGPGIVAGAVSLAAAVAIMAAARSVHPPAASTSLSFALRSGSLTRTLVFGLIVGITVLLIVLQRIVAWQARRLEGGE